MPTYTPTEYKRGAQNVYDNIIALYSLKGAFKVTKMVRILLKDEKARRMKLPKSERGFDDTPDKSKSKSKSKTKGKKKKKGPGMFASLCILFKKKGVHKVTYNEAKECCKKAKPDSNLSTGHFKWYKNQYRKNKKNG